MHVTFVTKFFSSFPLSTITRLKDLMVLSQWKSFLRFHNPKLSVIDAYTHNMLIKELKTRIRRNQLEKIEEIKQLIYKSHTLKDPRIIQTILKRCYLKGLYRDHEDIRYFLRAEITRWPNVNITQILNKESKMNLKTLEKTRIPGRELRNIPSLMKIMKFKDITDELIPLEICGEIDKENEKLNVIFQKVVKLYDFLQVNDSLHSRSLKPIVAIIPTTLLGDPIADCRFQNIIKKKITYIRNILSAIPPLDSKDFNYLTLTLDELYLAKKDKNIRREYKKFLRKTFMIDEDFNIKLNKYSFIKAKELNDETFFNS